MNRRDFNRCLLTLPALAWSGAHAQAPAWPTRTVRIIVPSAAGSPWDPLARLIADRLGPILGQTVIVENRSGATGLIGMDAVAKATDGHTIGVMFMPHVIAPSVFARVPYDILTDVKPITQTQWNYNVLVVNPTVPAKTVTELVNYVKGRPGKLTLVSGGNGTPAHLMGEYFKQLTKTFILHVPYRGPVPALQDLVGGQADLMFAATTPALPHIRSGRLRALAVASTTRLSALPDVPTFTEAGFAQFETRDWSGYVAAPSVPQAGIERLNLEIGKILREPAVIEQFEKLGIYLQGSTPAELATLMRNELRKWQGVVKTAGIRLEG